MSNKNMAIKGSFFALTGRGSSFTRIFLVVFSVLALPSLSLNAQNKYAGEFLAIGVGGRPLGMGGAYVSIANDVTAGYWNPGALSSINYPQFSLMHDERFGNLVNYDYASVAIPWGP